jgi:SSS family solute:Na+ symporter
MVDGRIHLAVADYVVILGYCFLVLWIGLWFRKRMATVGDYFAGGHQIPWWMAGISHYMSSFSAFSFIAYAQIAYLYGFTAITLFWVSVPACIGGGLFFARRWRRARVVTPVEFLEARYNGTLRQLFAWAGIPMKIFDDALKVFATGLFISVVCGVSLSWAVVICGGVMVAYSFFGGLWALVVTDYVQFLMKSLAIILLVPLAIRASGGIRRGFSGLPHGFFAPVNGPYGWLYLTGFACVMFVSYNASWSLAQKYYSVPNERDASKAAYLSALLNLFGAPLMILPGILGRHFLPDLASTGRSADTYVLLLVRLLPEGMIGIILAAMLSATMAAVSADFNAIASVLTEDIYHRLIDPNASPGKLFRTGRWLTFLLGFVTTLLSLWIVFSRREALFSLMVTVFGVFMAPTLLPILIGLVSRRATAGGAMAGFIAGFATGAGMLILKTFWKPAASMFGNLYGFEGVSLIVNTLMTLLGMVIGSLLWKRTASEAKRAAEFAHRLATPVLAISPQRPAASGFGIVLAVSTLVVSLLVGTAALISHSQRALVLDGGSSIAFLLISVFLFAVQHRNDRKTNATH